jgi:hypothetical protein
MVVPIPIGLREVAPLLRQIVKREDRRHGTDRDASTAINATVRLNIKLMRGRELYLLTAGVNHIARAGIYTRCILDTNARFGNHVWHIVRVGLDSHDGP